MIQLKNVSKFYYSKGMIASGFTKVNLTFDVGEFVVITGESGSGKTTLLNVISGLDSYEEGELYIEGKETSHYLASDFEEYRKKYIGNIFQNFNLVGSYTVYQNVELILRINGYTKEEMQEKVSVILDRVGMSEYAKTKVSKLSGGQKQRVAIARALAKETAIVVADEPTGNLDSESAEGIVQLLYEISKDKLVIVVTHNYDQFAPYATRKIKMHDGKVVEDEMRKKPAAVLPEHADSGVLSGNLSVGSKVRLGLRNTFNILPKFLLLLTVYLFIVLSVTSEYTTLKNSDEEAAKLGYNDYFFNYSEDRIVLKRSDGKAFSGEDYNRLKNTANVKSVVKEDILLDQMLYMEDEEFAYNAFPKNIEDFYGELTAGRMPGKNNETVLSGPEDDYFLLPENRDRILNRTFTITDDDGQKIKVKVVGIAAEEKTELLYSYGGTLYFSSAMMEKMKRNAYGSTSKVTTVANDNALVYEMGGQYYKPAASSKVEPGKALVSEEMNGYFEKGKAKDQKVSMTAENIFYKRTISLDISDTYNKKDFTSKTGLKDFEKNDGTIYINKTDYNKLFKASDYQVSVYLSDMKHADGTIAELKGIGYVPLVLKDTLMNGGNELLSIIKVPMAVVMTIAIFFIAYFVIQLILKSRSSYFSILRMLGLSKKNLRRILDVEMFAVINIAYGIFLIFAFLVHRQIIGVEYLKVLIEYLQISDYVILYGVLVLMSYLISGKFARKLFKKTAMGSYREEA